MARLITAGFESGQPGPVGSPTYDGESDVVTGRNLVPSGTVTYQNTTARNSGYAMQCGASAANYAQISGLTHVDGVPMFARFYLLTPDPTPSQTQILWVWRLNSITAADLVMGVGGTIWHRDANGVAVGSASAALQDNTWYRIESKIIVPAAGNGTLELRLATGDEPSSVVSTSSSVDVNNALTPTTHRVGHMTAAETQSTIYIDDLAINDGSGASQNDYPGPGNVSLLVAAADNAKGTGWEGPQTTGSDTTNLYDNVNNIPPAAATTAIPLLPAGAGGDVDANAGKFIFNVANLGAASEYRATCLAPVFICPTGAPIMLSQAYMRASCDSLTGTNNMELQGITPADSAATFNVEQTAVAGTEPTGWKSGRTAPTYRPSLPLTTTPVVEATKILTGSTRGHMVDQLGLLIEWRTPVERSASISATSGIAVSGEYETPVTVHERSASISATADIAVSATFFSIVSRSASIDATAAITVAGQRDLLRSAAIAATSSIAAAGQRDLLRSTAISATATIEVSGESETPAAGVVERSASISATATISVAAFRRDHLRAASIGAVSLIEIGSGYREIARQAAISATSGIAVGYRRDHVRDVAIAATSDIEVAGQVEGIATEWERSASISATSSITVVGRRVLLRSASIQATSGIAVAGTYLSVFERSAAIQATATLTVGRQVVAIRQLSIGATSGIEVVSTYRLVDRAVSIDGLATIEVADWDSYSGALVERALAIAATSAITIGATERERGAHYGGDVDGTYGGDDAATYGGVPAASYSGDGDATYDGADDWTYTPTTG